MLAAAAGWSVGDLGISTVHILRRVMSTSIKELTDNRWHFFTGHLAVFAAQGNQNNGPKTVPGTKGNSWDAAQEWEMHHYSGY